MKSRCFSQIFNLALNNFIIKSWLFITKQAEKKAF